jgi:hypothetical protein
MTAPRGRATSRDLTDLSKLRAPPDDKPSIATLVRAASQPVTLNRERALLVEKTKMMLADFRRALNSMPSGGTEEYCQWSSRRRGLPPE